MTTFDLQKLTNYLISFSIRYTKIKVTLHNHTGMDP